MDLSVIIVNYNVKYFLEQCLHAVFMALQKIDGEVIVVDNNSADGSAHLVTEKFPQVILITNSENLGFARANNQAIKCASGKYILLLNPDTVVQEDTFLKCLSYIECHDDVSCIGVKMIDGKGRYLPESKRALPTPPVAFYKIFGFSSLFPKSKRFGKYHLGYLSRDEIHEVDVISGAFMFIRKVALLKVGLLDEDYFMYGEDIDLSYRFKKAGYHNIYFPLTTIIHYKGESTKKSSINYVILFYRAMIIFAGKHFLKNSYRFYSNLIQLAVYFRAGLSILRRFILGIITPLLDALLIYAGYSAFLPLWEKYHFGGAGSYPPVYLGIVVPVYIAIWMGSILLTTGYGKKVRLSELIRGVLTGSLVILITYALLPEKLRFSRALILIGACWTLLATISVRYLLKNIYKEISFEFLKKRKRIIIIGELQESQRVHAIVSQAQVIPELVGFVDARNDLLRQGFIGNIGQIEDIVTINQVDELIFCAASISSQEIIKTMLHFTDSGIEFKIAPPESLSVIGSNSHDTSGELYILHFNTLSRIRSRRKKRLLDILMSTAFLVLVPVWIFVIKDPAGMFRNILYVLIGLSSWVGYYKSTGGQHPDLPRIRPGILTPHDLCNLNAKEKGTNEQMNLLYAKDYKIIHDMRIILKGFRHLGRRPAFIQSIDSQTDEIGYGQS